MPCDQRQNRKYKGEYPDTNPSCPSVMAICVPRKTKPVACAIHTRTGHHTFHEASLPNIFAYTLQVSSATASQEWCAFAKSFMSCRRALRFS